MSLGPIVLGIGLGLALLAFAGLRRMFNKSLSESVSGFWPMNSGFALACLSMYLMARWLNPVLAKLSNCAWVLRVGLEASGRPPTGKLRLVYQRFFNRLGWNLGPKNYGKRLAGHLQGLFWLSFIVVAGLLPGYSRPVRRCQRTG